jgi:signal transduction histidine kinase
VAAAGIWTLNEQEQVLELQAAGGGCPQLFQGMTCVPVGSLTIGSIAINRKRQVLYAGDVEPAPAGEGSAKGHGVSDFVGYPLLLDSKLIGVMAVFSPDELSPSAIDAMAAAGDGIALGIERKRAEGELAHRAQQLAMLVEELRVTQRQAEAATRAKSDFLASMSHELRTPLNAIILYSELLQEEAEDHGNGSSIADLQRIQSAGKHLLDLINGILDLSKIEAGKMGLSLEDFEVKAMLGELVDTVAPLVQKNSNVLTVHCADDVGTIHGDLTKTRQILLNLLSNASKFTKLGSITVDVRRRSIDGVPCVEFGVADTGVGMTEAQTLKVFEAFTQADVTTTRKYGGTGLGLAIVSRFCELMGGSVSVKSQPGEGARFIVHLPVEMVDTAVEAMVPAGIA